MERRKVVLVVALLIVALFSSISLSPAKETKSAKVLSLSNGIKDGTAKLWAHVQNTGTIPLGNGCKVRFWVRNRNKSIDDYVGSRPCTVSDWKKDGGPGELKPGEKRWYLYSWSIPEDAIPGTYKYWAIVEDSGEEISKWSSAKSFTIKKPAKSAKVISLWDVKVKDGKVRLWAHVQNIGNTSLGSNCKVRFWVRNRNKSIDGYVGSRPCTVSDWKKDGGPDELKPGRKRWYLYSWSIPKDAIPGTYKYWAIVEDSGEEVSKWSSAKSFRYEPHMAFDYTEYFVSIVSGLDWISEEIAKKAAKILEKGIKKALLVANIPSIPGTFDLEVTKRNGEWGVLVKGWLPEFVWYQLQNSTLSCDSQGCELLGEVYEA